MRLSHGSAPPGGIYVALCGTNQIEATMLKVHSTNEKAGQNPLTEAEGQTKLSLPAILNVHGGGNDQHNCAFN